MFFSDSNGLSRYSSPILKRFSPVTMALLILTFLMSINAGAQEQTIQNPSASQAVASLAVSASATLKAPPDLAYFSAAVETHGPTAEEAVAENNAIMQSLMQVLNDRGIAEKDRQTASFSINPTMLYPDRNKPEPPRITGYQVTNQLRVTVRDLSRMGSLLDALVKAGLNSSGQLDFALDNPEKLYEEALKQAIDKAMAKAKAMAAQAGVSLGPVISLSEGSASGPQPYRLQAMRMAESASAVPLAAGEENVTASVQMIFQIMPASPQP
jgi:uncharacterized protein YggE